MRICPKCGHKDHPMWRANAWNPMYDYAHYDSIEWNEPELWQFIKNSKVGEVIERPPFVYWKSKGKSNTVRRCWIEDFKRVGKKGDPQERVHGHGQTKLFNGDTH